MRRTLIGLLSAAAVTVTALAIVRARDSVADELLVYRLPLPEGESIEAGIAFLEGRVAQRPKEGLDLAELAAMQIEMSRRSGDRKWLEAAAVSARRSLENLPVSNEGAKLALAKVANARHDFPEAIRHANEVLAESPRSTEALTVRATANVGLGNLTEALADADRVLAAMPLLGAHALRGTVLEAMGRDDEALAEWRAALRVEDMGQVASSSWVRAAIGRLHVRRGNLRDARAWLEEARRLTPGQPIALLALAEVESLEGDTKAAERLCNTGFQFTKDPTFFARLASVRERAGDRPGAETAWSQAEALLRSELESGEYGHRVELARVLLARGGSSRAAEALALTTAELERRRPADLLALHETALAASGDAVKAR